MGHTFPNHISNSCYRSPTVYYIGTQDPPRDLARGCLRVHDPGFMLGFRGLRFVGLRGLQGFRG